MIAIALFHLVRHLKWQGNLGARQFYIICDSGRIVRKFFESFNPISNLIFAGMIINLDRRNILDQHAQDNEWINSGGAAKCMSHLLLFLSKVSRGKFESISPIMCQRALSHFCECFVKANCLFLDFEFWKKNRTSEMWRKRKQQNKKEESYSAWRVYRM